MSAPGDAVTVVERAWREERAAVLATLIRHVGDYQLAEDAVQDAFATAVATWPRDGAPANPGAWLTVVTARRKAIDRLGRLLPGEAEVHGLLGLMLLHDARRGARVDDRGDYVALDEQDRTRWDAGRVREGLGALAAAAPLHRPGPYQLQAAIAAEHVREPAGPDWRSIAELYAALARIAPSPVVEVNRAVAVAHADGPVAGSPSSAGETRRRLVSPRSRRSAPGGSARPTAARPPWHRCRRRDRTTRRAGAETATVRARRPSRRRSTRAAG